MRILLLSETLNPETGGIGTSTSRLAHNLGSAGVELAVVTFNSSTSLNEMPGFYEHRVSPHLVYYSLFPHFTNLQQQLSAKKKATIRRNSFTSLSTIIEMVRPDVLHSFSLTEAGYLGTLIAKAFKLPHMVSVRGNDIGRGLFQGDRFEVVRWILENADIITFVNSYLLSVAEGLFPDVGGKSHIIANSIEIEELTAVSAEARKRFLDELKIEPSSMLVAFAGTLREKKAPQALLHSISILSQTIIANLIIIGSFNSSSEEENFWKAAHRYSVYDEVRILGKMSHSLSRAYVEMCDIMLLPSLDDGMANTLLEAMERARPVVVSDIFADVIRDQVDGLVCNRFELDSFGRALCRLAIDFELRDRLGKAARQRASLNFNPAIETGSYLKLYETLCKRPD